MKKLLLTSAIVAVAGAASAEITWSGDASVYFNDTTEVVVDGTTYYVANGTAQDVIDLDGSIGDDALTEVANPLNFEAGLTASASTELDNGITATLSYDFDLKDHNDGDDGVFTFDNNFPTLTIEAPQFTVRVGDVDHAAHDLFTGHTEGVEFTENDGELVGRIDGNIAGFEAGVSYVAADAFNDEGLARGSWTVGTKGEFAGATVSAAYEERGGFNGLEYTDKSYYHGVFGVAAGYEWNGISGTVAYATGNVENNQGDDAEKATSIGLTASYDWNGYTVYGEIANYDDGIDYGKNADGDDIDNVYSAYKVGAKGEVQGATFDVFYYDDNDRDNNDTDYASGNEGFGIDASYEWNGATFNAGYDSGEFINYITDVDQTVGANDPDAYGAFYVGAEYAVGEGASVYATYANADEIGAPEFDAGMTVGMKLSF